MASERAYSKGSPWPPLRPGLLRLYSMRFCPYAHRTRLILNFLNVPHEIINIDLRHKPEWLFQKNPFGLVPIIELDDKILYESHICNEFLDEVYGDNKLLTKDPYKKAQQKIILEHFVQAIPSFYGVQLALKPDEVKGHLVKLEDKLKVFENALDGKYFGGDVPGFVDFSIWPWFERLPIFRKYKGVDVLERKSNFPKLLAWISEMESLPAVRDSYVPLEDIEEFMKQYYNPFVAHPNFDVGLKE